MSGHCSKASGWCAARLRASGLQVSEQTSLSYNNWDSQMCCVPLRDAVWSTCAQPCWHKLGSWIGLCPGDSPGGSRPTLYPCSPAGCWWEHAAATAPYLLPLCYWCGGPLLHASEGLGRPEGDSQRNGRHLQRAPLRHAPGAVWRRHAACVSSLATAAVQPQLFSRR